MSALVLAWLAGAASSHVRAPFQDADVREGITTRTRPDGRAGFGTFEPPRRACLDEAQRALIEEAIEMHRELLTQAGLLPEVQHTLVTLDWPLRATGSAADGFGVHGISNFVDLNPAGPGALLDYRCGTRTYDDGSYDHSGIDFFTWPFPWVWMDDDEVEIVAAAPGTIVFKSGGHGDQSCTFGGTWNAVYVQHADGSVAWYGHMKRHSLTSKVAGDAVAAGEFLGIVGSSGSSTGPHLHLELHDYAGSVIDANTGPCNPLSQGIRWRHQRPYYDSAINRLMIGSAPASYPACPGRVVTNEAATIPRGTTAYFTAFYRDQLGSQTSTYRIRRPNGTTFASWSHSSGAAHYAASWWWWSALVPAGAATGTWTFEVTFEGSIYAKTFTVI